MTICKPILDNIFKERFRIESNNEWKSKAGFGTFLTDKFKNIELSDTHRMLLDSGELEKWNINLLSIILENYNFTKLDKIKIEKENEEILKIRDHFKKLSKIKNDQISILEYNEIFESLKYSIKLLDPKNQIKSFELFESEDIFKFNYENENNEKEKEEIKSFLEIGDRYFRKKEYEQALGEYVLAEKTISTISTDLNSRIAYRLGITKIELFIGYINSSVGIPKNEIESLLESRDFLQFSLQIKCIQYRCYFQLGRSYTFTSDYELAIKYYDIALHLLDEVDLQYTMEIKQEEKRKIQVLRAQSIQKLSFFCYDPITGERDIEKEQEKIIDSRIEFSKEYYNKLVRGQGDLSISSEEFPSDKLVQFSNEQNVPLEILKNKIYELNGLVLLNYKRYKEAYQYLYRSALFGFSASCYYLYFILFFGPIVQNEIKQNRELAIAFLYRSLKPSPSPTFNKKLKLAKTSSFSKLIQGFDTCSDIKMVYSQLASYTLHGFLNIDIEKSIYYFKKAIELGDVESLYVYGRLIFYGPDSEYCGLSKGLRTMNKFEKDEEKGLKYIKMAADKKNAEAMDTYQLIIKHKQVREFSNRLLSFKETNNKFKNEIIKFKNSLNEISKLNENEINEFDQFSIINHRSKVNLFKNSIKFLQSLKIKENLNVDQIKQLDSLIKQLKEIENLAIDIRIKNEKNQTKEIFDFGKIGKTILQDEIHAECQVDYIKNIGRLDQQSKFGSKQSKRLVTGVALLQKFLQLLEKNPQKVDEQFECIDPIAKLYLSSECYIATPRNIPLKQIDQLDEILDNLKKSITNSTSMVNFQNFSTCLISIFQYSDRNTRNDMIKFINDFIKYSGNNKNNHLPKVEDEKDLLYLYFLRGKFYRYQCDFKMAIKDFLNVIKQDPNYHNHYVYYYLADMYSIQLLSDEADETCQNAIKYYLEFINRSPNDDLKLPESYSSLSTLYDYLGDIEKSKQFKEKEQQSIKNQLSIFKEINPISVSNEYIKTKLIF